MPAGLDALDDRVAHEGSENENGYVETPMNSDGFFADSGDQVIFAHQLISINYRYHYLLLLSGLLSEGGAAHQATYRARISRWKPAHMCRVHARREQASDRHG